MLAATGRLGEFDISSLSSLDDEDIPPIRRSSATRLSASRIQTTSYAPDSDLNSPEPRPRRAMSTTNVQVNSFPSTVMNDNMQQTQMRQTMSISSTQMNSFSPVGQHIPELNEFNGLQYSDLSLTPSTSSSEYSQTENSAHRLYRLTEASQIETHPHPPYTQTQPPELPPRQAVVHGSHVNARQTMAVGPQLGQTSHGPHGPQGPHVPQVSHGLQGPHGAPGPPGQTESVTDRLARIREDLIRYISCLHL